MVDKVKQVPNWSECTKQARAAAMLSFFCFLSRRTDGLIKRLQPSKEGEGKTFFKVRDEVVTQAMTLSQWSKWLVELDRMNRRDALIAKVVLQGGKRIGEVLSLQTHQIDFERQEISFQQSKSKTFRRTIITYPDGLMKQLIEYLEGRSGTVFITSRGNAVLRKQVAYTFAKSGERSGVPFLVTPHVLRASAITYLKSQGYSDSEIRQITGHASGEMVTAYDRRSRADNISKNISLIG
jgi:integrase